MVRSRACAGSPAQGGTFLSYPWVLLLSKLTDHNSSLRALLLAAPLHVQSRLKCLRPPRANAAQRRSREPRCRLLPRGATPRILACAPAVAITSRGMAPPRQAVDDPRPSARDLNTPSQARTHALRPPLSCAQGHADRRKLCSRIEDLPALLPDSEPGASRTKRGQEPSPSSIQRRIRWVDVEY